MKAKLLNIAADIRVSGDRQQAAAEVFRPSHILPTYTVEQAGMIELREVRLGLECVVVALKATHPRCTGAYSCSVYSPR